MRYRFTIHYRSDAGEWHPGDVAEFDADTAAWLLRDVPGCIEPVTERALDGPSNDRQVKRAPRIRNDRGPQQAIDKGSFKATRSS